MHCCSLTQAFTAAIASPDSHCCSLAQKAHKSRKTTLLAGEWNHRCLLSMKSLLLAFAAGSYPSKSLLLASPWCHLLLLLASDRPGRQCFSLTQSVTATRQLTEPLLLATSGSHCSQVHGTIAAYKPSKSVLSASPISHCGSLAQAVSAVT